MELFKGQNLLEFAKRFKSDADSKNYLAHILSGQKNMSV